jgi:manganese transport protein
MGTFVSAPRTKFAGWAVTGVIVALNAVLLAQIAFG